MKRTGAGNRDGQSGAVNLLPAWEMPAERLPAGRLEGRKRKQRTPQRMNRPGHTLRRPFAVSAAWGWTGGDEDGLPDG